MAPYVSMINELTPAKISSRIKVRCVRSYKVLFNGNPNNIISSECIVRDREGVKIHISCPQSLMETLASKKKEGHLYLISNFFVRPNKMKYKTTNHVYRLFMYLRTKIFEVNEDDFPNQMFSSKSFEEVLAIEEVDGVPLFDIIEVVKSCVESENHNCKKLELQLEDENHLPMYCTLWEQYKDQYRQQLDVKEKKLPIVVIQFCKANPFKGGVRTGTVYNCSKVLLNADIQEVRDFRERIFGDESFIKPLAAASQVPKLRTDDGFKDGNMSIKAIEELFCLEDNFYGQNGSHWICARIEAVECFGQWFYMSCKRCSKKVSMLDNRFFCNRCNKYDRTSTQRYMFKIDVFDGTSTAQLLLWDKESAQLLGKKAVDVNLKAEEVGRQNVIPTEIEQILIGQVVLFKIQLRNETDFNKDHPYSVSKICNDPIIVKTHSVCLDTCTNDQKDHMSFYEECNTLSQITDLGSIDETGKISDYSLVSPKTVDLTIGNEDDWMIGRSAKRCLDDDWEDSNSEKKERIMVKQDVED